MKIRAVALFLLLSLAVSFPAAAKKIPPRFLYMRTTVMLNGAEIREGMYEMTLEPSNSGVRVTFSRDGRFVATAPGAWVKSGTKFAEDAVLLQVNPDGSRSVIEIRLAGAAKTIVLHNSDAVSQYSMK